DAMNNLVQVCARVDVVRDARGDDRENVGRAFSAAVEPGEEPVLATENEAPELALASVVGGLDVPVVEEEEEPPPLAIDVSETSAERCIRRRCRLLSIEPLAKFLEHWST